MDDLGWQRAVEVLGALEKELEFWRTEVRAGA